MNSLETSDALRVERVAQPVAQEIDRHDREEDRQSRETEKPRCRVHFALRVLQHMSPQVGVGG